MALTDKLTAIGDAIRAKKGTTDKYTLEGMAAAIDSIETGVDTSDATAAAEDIVKDKTAYVNGAKVTGTLESEAIANLTKYVSDPSDDILVRFEGKALTDGYVRADEYNVKLNVERNVAYALFGYATPADVAKGQTFTSGDGIKQTGTKEETVAPSGSISITANGTYDVTDKASAEVNVPTSVTQLSCVTDLGLLSFAYEVKTITVNGTAHEYVEYTSNAFSVPASLAFFDGEFRYSICIPFNFPYRVGTTQYDCFGTGFLYIWFSQDPATTNLVTTGSITMGADIFTLMAMDSFPAESMPEGTTWFINCVKLIILDDEGTSYQIKFTLSTQDTENLGILAPPDLVSGINYLTTHLENVRGLLITYEEETGT